MEDLKIIQFTTMSLTISSYSSSEESPHGRKEPKKEPRLIPPRPLSRHSVPKDRRMQASCTSVGAWQLIMATREMSTIPHNAFILTDFIDEEYFVTKCLCYKCTIALLIWRIHAMCMVPMSYIILISAWIGVF